VKLHILSDLHLEMMNPPYGWRIPQTSADVVVLAGDIGVGTAGVEWAIGESERLHKPAIYVPGNHEYYNQRLTVLEQMKAMAGGSSVHLLDMDAVVLEGVRFLGATLWTDYLLCGRALRPAAMEQAQRALNDHRLINPPEGFSPADALARHEVSRAWLERELAERFDGATVVVTHHAPAPEGTHPRFREDILTAAFVSNFKELIGTYRPRLWVHGHSHHCAQYMVSGTQLVANQMGYPHQPATGHFDPNLVIEVGEQ
jgi:predicted phosphodiesterase